MATNLPSIRVHKSTFQYVVYHAGKRHYLGAWTAKDKRPPESVQVAYSALIGKILSIAEEPIARPDLWSMSLTVGDLVERFLVDVQRDRPKTVSRWRCYLRPLAELYADWPIGSFGPSRLLKVQDHLIAAGNSRSGINHTIGRIRQAFAWGVYREFAKPELLVGLKTVPPVRFGRALEKSARGMVPDSIIEETLPHLPPRIRAMVQIQRASGMRPGEVCALTMGQIDRAKSVWWFKPTHHKTAHMGRRRWIPLGPKAQEALAPWLRADPEKPLFSPAESVEEWRKSKRKKGKAAKVANYRERPPGAQYTPNRYGQIIRAACAREGIPVWSPNQLRKAAAQAVYESLGLDHARALLGHHSDEITNRHYLSQELGKAEAAALKIG